MKIASITAGLIVVALLVSWSSSNQETKLPDGVGINVSYMDSTVKPSEDFFQFVNGGWIKRNEIPADLGAYGSFTELREQNQNVLLEILRKAAESGKYRESSDQKKAADFYSVGAGHNRELVLDNCFVRRLCC